MVCPLLCLCKISLQVAFSFLGRVRGLRLKAPSQGGLQYVRVVLGVVRLSPKGDPVGPGCSTPKGASDRRPEQSTD